MISEGDLKTVLAADSGVGGFATLLTGGIYTRVALKRGGLNKANAPSAYSGPILQPCALIRDRTTTPDNQINDAGAQERSQRQVMLVILYDDGDSDRSTLESAMDRLYVLVEGQRVTYPLMWGGVMWTRDEALDNAHMGRATIYIHGVT